MSTDGRLGWRCPVCLRGVSPDREYCEHPARRVIQAPAMVTRSVGADAADMHAPVDPVALREIQEKLVRGEEERRNSTSPYTPPGVGMGLFDPNMPAPTMTPPASGRYEELLRDARRTYRVGDIDD